MDDLLEFSFDLDGSRAVTDLLMQEYPHVVEVPPGTSHKIERDAWIKESYGEQANSVFEDTTLRVNTKARWAAWYGYRFRDPSDAIHFKLRWH